MPRLQLLEQIAQLAQHLLGHVARALPRHVLDIAHHALEILRSDHLVLRHAGRHFHRLLAFGLLGELLHELRQRLAQLLHELADFLVRCALLERLGQVLLRLAQPALGVGQIAVLQSHRDMPELVDDALEAGPRGIALQAPDRPSAGRDRLADR